MMRRNIWPRSPGAALPWPPSPLQRNPCEFLADIQWTHLGGDRKNLKNHLTDLLRCLKQAKADTRSCNGPVSVLSVAIDLCFLSDLTFPLNGLVRQGRVRRFSRFQFFDRSGWVRPSAHGTSYAFLKGWASFFIHRINFSSKTAGAESQCALIFARADRLLNRVASLLTMKKKGRGCGQPRPANAWRGREKPVGGSD